MTQLTKQDRQEIEYYLKKGHGPTAIGLMISRSKSVISSEVKRNSVNGKYSAEKADLKAYQRRYWVLTDPQKIRGHPALETYIESKLKRRNPWSPAQIAGRWN